MKLWFASNCWFLKNTIDLCMYEIKLRYLYEISKLSEQREWLLVQWATSLHSKNIESSIFHISFQPIVKAFYT